MAAFTRIRELTDQGLTVILITHRLAATADADLIYVLHHGRLIEQGTHEELMAQQTQYREAHVLQASQYETRTLPHQRSRRVDHDGASR